MASAGISGVVGQQGQQNTNGTDAFGDVDLQEFLAMMIAELQNQDPLNPMDNAQILQQVSQIQEIESNKKLNESLASVTLGQNLTAAGSMLGQVIRGLAEDDSYVVGKVDRVSISDGTPTLHIGQSQIALKNVTEILSDPPEDGQSEDGLNADDPTAEAAP